MTANGTRRAARGLRAGRRVTAGGVMLALSCGGPAERDPSRSARLPEGIVARVGDEVFIRGASVERVAAKLGVAPSVAGERAIRDALFEAEARRVLPSSLLRVATRGVLARAMYRNVVVETRQSAISEDELGRATETFWTYYARPRGYRTVHAVVLVPPDAPREAHEEAKRRLALIRDAWAPFGERLRGTSPPERDEEQMFRWEGSRSREPIFDELEQAATAAAGAMGMKVQQLPPVTEEGYIIDHADSQSTVDVRFAQAASRLEARGTMSPIVSSHAGWHVMMLLEVTPARQVDDATRRERLRPFIHRQRAQDAIDAVLKATRPRVRHANNADALLQVLAEAAGP
ncbi:MAG: hypothetical protein AAF715_30770 [Myxococcota bacterium]